MTIAILLRRALARPGQSDEHEVLGPCERGALVGGLRLASGLGQDAIAVTVGPARREDRVLAMALRAGCARAVRLAAEGLDDLDYLGVAETLAAAVRKLGAELVVCGERSLDERLGAIGPAVAELLGYAHVTGVGSLTVEGSVVLCERHGDRDRLRIKVRPPAVLCMRPPRIAAEREADLIPSAAARARTQALEERSDAKGGGGPAGSAGGAGGRDPRGIDAFDPEDVGLDLRRLAPRKAAAGRLRPTRGGRHATILASPSDLVGQLTAERLIAPRRGGSGDDTP